MYFVPIYNSKKNHILRVFSRYKGIGHRFGSKKTLFILIYETKRGIKNLRFVKFSNISGRKDCTHAYTRAVIRRDRRQALPKNIYIYNINRYTPYIHIETRYVRYVVLLPKRADRTRYRNGQCKFACLANSSGQQMLYNKSTICTVRTQRTRKNHTRLNTKDITFLMTQKKSLFFFTPYVSYSLCRTGRAMAPHDTSLAMLLVFFIYFFIQYLMQFV